MTEKLTALVLSLMATVMCLSCSHEDAKPDFAAAAAAKEYYDSLNNGGHEYFTTMSLPAERIPESYREQLVANTKMYLAGLRNEHKGISEVRVIDCKNNPRQSTAEAYLLLCFSDSVKEEIVVPMVKRSGKWMMR